MIDKISLKILNELGRDGRLTNVDLAKKLDISVITASRKVKALIDNEVIAIKALPLPSKMGYMIQALVGLKVNLKKIGSVCTSLMNYPNVNMLTTTFGRFDILFIVFFTNSRDFCNFIDDVRRLAGVNNVTTFMNSSKDKNWNTGGPSKTNKVRVIDKIDYKIIEELRHNGRPSYIEMAEKLGISRPTLSRRINFLLKEEFIRIVAVPNHNKIGYSANAYVLVQTKPDKIEKICKQLDGYPEVRMIMKLYSDFSICFCVISQTIDTLLDFLYKKVATIDGVLTTETLIQGNVLYFSTDGILTTI